jgi:radical SAM-linked protein
MKAQRLRITFGRTDDMKYVTHLDMMRFWERALRRADIPVAYSEGFSPHAQISIAAPLAVGVTSEAELMDVYLSQPMPPKQLLIALSSQIPPGIQVLAAQEVGMAQPALQADVRLAEYDVDVPADAGHADRVVDEFLAKESIPWEHKRENETRTYDIRAQVDSFSVEDNEDGGITLKMRLKNDNTGSGRPEQIVAALGLPPPTRIHRTKLILAATSTAREAWRKRGRFQE